MSRELNTEFFGIHQEDKKTITLDVPVIDWLPVKEEKKAALKSDLTTSEIEELKSQYQELHSSTKHRLDRMQNLIQKWEQNHSDLSHEVASKISLLLQKLNEQKKFDQKVQDIIDRHNNLLKGYEVRMNQLQKLLQQKESDFAEALSALKEAKSEIALLKRV
ncbi:MAG: hypothetical protein L6Q37_06940 [Bdellovibrionaceae bacterium]|nr:hypothetical protein [Pseudobdellovibrionaceae bacterium]NUM59530.1 hypothetical protein [Pseudobdellovibrionaceae bacterium]